MSTPNVSLLFPLLESAVDSKSPPHSCSSTSSLHSERVSVVVWHCLGYARGHLQLRGRAEQLVSLSLALEPWLQNVGGLDLSCLGELPCHDQNTLQNADCWLNYRGSQAEWATATPVLNGAAFLPSRLSGGCIYYLVPPVYWPGGMNWGQPGLRGQAVTCSSSTTTKNFGVLVLGGIHELELGSI